MWRVFTFIVIAYEYDRDGRHRLMSFLNKLFYETIKMVAAFVTDALRPPAEECGVTMETVTPPFKPRSMASWDILLSSWRIRWLANGAA